MINHKRTVYSVTTLDWPLKLITRTTCSTMLSLVLQYTLSPLAGINLLCVQFVGYTLSTSSENATAGLNFTFTCDTMHTVLSFTKNTDTVCTVTGGNTDGACDFSGSPISDYIYTCNPTTNTYTVTIPGSYVTDSLHGTQWKCHSVFGGETSNTKIVYVNGELFIILLFL